MCSPSIATSSNNASSRTNAWGDSGECGCGVRNVVRTGPTWCGVGCCPPITGVQSVPVAPIGFTLDRGIMDPGVGSRGLSLACIGVQISMSPSEVGGGDRGLAVMLAPALPCHKHQQRIAENTDGRERAGPW